MKLLLNEKRVDVNKARNDGVTPLYMVCYYGNVEFVKLLLNDERVDINKATVYDTTPFCVACLQGHIEIVKYFLACGRGIDINKKNNEGKTAIDIARRRNEMDIVELIESFLKNQNEARPKLRIQLGLPGSVSLFLCIFILCTLIFQK